VQCQAIRVDLTRMGGTSSAPRRGSLLRGSTTSFGLVGKVVITTVLLAVGALVAIGNLFGIPVFLVFFVWVMRDLWVPEKRAVPVRRTPPPTRVGGVGGGIGVSGGVGAAPGAPVARLVYDEPPVTDPTSRPS
jgi:hypothetical protein